MKVFATFFSRHRKRMAVLILLPTILSPWGFSRITFNDDPRAFIRRTDESFQPLQQLFEDFGPDDNDLLLVLVNEDMFTRESIQVVRDLVARVHALDRVSSVASLLSIRRIGQPVVPLVPSSEASAQRYAKRRAEALDHPLVAGQLLSEDGTTMLVVLRIAGDSQNISEIGPMVDRIAQIGEACTQGTDVQFSMAGHQPVRVDIIRNANRDFYTLATFSVFISWGVGYLVFRRIAAVMICVIGPFAGTLWTIGLIGACGLELNGLTAALPMLLFVIGFTSAVHLMVHIRYCRTMGFGRVEAATDAVHHLTKACALTSLTTGIGFGSLAWSPAEAIQVFGVMCAVGVVVTFLAVITIVPLAASTHLGDYLLPRCRKVTTDFTRAQIVGVLVPVLRCPKGVAMTGILMTVLCAISALWLRSDIHWTEFMPDDSQTRRAAELCDRQFGGSLLVYTVVQWPEEQALDSAEVLEALGEVHELLESESLMRGASSVLDMMTALSPDAEQPAAGLRHFYRIPVEVRNRMVRSDLRRAVVTAHIPDVGAAALKPAFARVERRLDELQNRHAGFQFELTGSGVVASQTVHGIITDLGKGLGTAAVIVFLLMIVVFRSLRLGLISIIPNAFPLVLVAAVLVWTGQPLQLASAWTFGMCLGLAVDDTIHFLVRYRREVETQKDGRRAVRRTMEVVGTALVMTTWILLSGFATMLFSSMPMNRLFGYVACIAVAAALVGDMLFLPALLIWFDAKRAKRIWKTAKQSEVSAYDDDNESNRRFDFDR